MEWEQKDGVSRRALDVLSRRYFVPEYRPTEPLTAKDACKLLKEGWDMGDIWGTFTALAFDVAGELTWRGEHVDGYYPGASGDGRSDDHYTRAVLTMTSTHALEAVLGLCEEMQGKARREGLDY